MRYGGFPEPFLPSRIGNVRGSAPGDADPKWEYNAGMILIRFADSEAERQALGFLAGRFTFKTWTGGETVVSEAALAGLAQQGIRFSVEGRATYDRLVPAIRDSAASAVQ